MDDVVLAPDGSVYNPAPQPTPIQTKPTAKQLADLPSSKLAGNAMWHSGGRCPVAGHLKISVWYGGFKGRDRGWWIGRDRADRLDWSQPCIYRLRESALRPEAKDYKRIRLLAIVRQLQKYAEEIERLA